VLTALRQARLPGVRFSGVQFVPHQPGDGKYADTALVGIRLVVTDRSTYDPPAVAIHLLAIIRALYSSRFGWIPAHFDRLAGGPTLRQEIDRGLSPDSIVRSWRPELDRFLERRKPVLLYPDQ
jgi:uncharacterized protein YbbC (DUF1343 family)